VIESPAYSPIPRTRNAHRHFNLSETCPNAARLGLSRKRSVDRPAGSATRYSSTRLDLCRRRDLSTMLGTFFYRTRPICPAECGNGGDR
jgi:hypothetical protein